jgi:uncharacterized membrane protein
MEEALSLVLKGGVLSSAALILLGLALIWITGDNSNPFGVMKLGWMIYGNPFFEPSHILFLGFAILVMTPIMRVAASILIYLKQRDLQFATITTIVLLILTISLKFGIG